MSIILKSGQGGVVCELSVVDRLDRSEIGDTGGASINDYTLSILRVRFKFIWMTESLLTTSMTFRASQELGIPKPRIRLSYEPS